MIRIRALGRHAATAIGLTLAATAAVAAPPTTQPASRPVPVRVLLVTGGKHHDYAAAMDRLARAIEAERAEANRADAKGAITIHILRDLGDLTPERLAACEVLFINTCTETGLSAAQHDAIIAAMRRGTGLVAMHCGLFSFLDWPEWRKILGGHVTNHDPYGSYDVRVVDTAHPITAGLPTPFTVTDEPYLVEDRGPDIHVLAQTTTPRSNRTEPEPQVWTTRYAGARVFVSTFGHDDKTLVDPNVVRLMANGILWAARRLGPPTMLSELERAEGFRPLFDGRALDGWKYDPKHWTVRDGVIIGRSEPPGLVKNSFAISKESFGDFVLRFSVRLINSNSGVQFRSQELPDYEVAGYQADAVLLGWGNLHEQNGRARLVDGWTGKGEKAVNPNDWNDMEVEARGPHIVIRVNGVTTADYTEADATRPRSGILALQLHRGDPMEVRFTNIRIRPLAPTTRQ